MKFIEVSYLEAKRFVKSIDFFRCFMSLNKSFVDISDLSLPYDEAKKIVATEDSAGNELFMIPLAYDKNGAELLCKALKMYHLSEDLYYDTDKKSDLEKEIDEGFTAYINQICEDILAKYK